MFVERELILRSSADAGGGDLIIARRASADDGGAERKRGVRVTQTVDARREGAAWADARCLRGARGGGSCGLTQRMPAEVSPTRRASETSGGCVHLYITHTDTLKRNCLAQLRVPHCASGWRAYFFRLRLLFEHQEITP